MDINDAINYFPVGGTLSQDTTTWLRKDVNGNTSYYGYALNLSADPALPIWRIRKEVTSSTVTVVTYANGDGLFDNIWDNRTSLSYK